MASHLLSRILPSMVLSPEKQLDYAETNRKGGLINAKRG